LEAGFNAAGLEVGFDAGLDTVLVAGADAGFLTIAFDGVEVLREGVTVLRSTILGAALSSVGLEAAGLEALLSAIIYPR